MDARSSLSVPHRRGRPLFPGANCPGVHGLPVPRPQCKRTLSDKGPCSVFDETGGSPLVWGRALNLQESTASGDSCSFTLFIPDREADFTEVIIFQQILELSFASWITKKIRIMNHDSNVGVWTPKINTVTQPFLGLSDMRQGCFLNSTGRQGCFLNSTGRQGCFLNSTGRHYLFL